MKTSLDQIRFNEAPQRTFKNLNEYKCVRTNILKKLAHGKHQKNSKGDSYMFDRLRVDFSTQFKSEEIWLDHINGYIVLQAPMRKSENKDSLSSRRLQYYGQLIKQIESMTAIGVATIFLLLDESGRKQLTNHVLSTNKKSKTEDNLSGRVKKTGIKVKK